MFGEDVITQEITVKRHGATIKTKVSYKSVGAGSYKFQIGDSSPELQCYGNPLEPQGPGVPSAVEIIMCYPGKPETVVWSAWWRDQKSRKECIDRLNSSQAN